MKFNRAKFQIPKKIIEIIKKLEAAGFEAYLVGGCVRDILLKANPKDWDIATNAKPEEIQKIFPESVYENKFGTVGVKTASKDERLKIVEITTFRLEGKYTDKRHPDEIKFAKTIEEDLSRRDFTINALALKVIFGKKLRAKIIDPFGGRKALEKKIIKAVGNPDERFKEDALRLVRAARFACQLGFWAIDAPTKEAIIKNTGLLNFISEERVRDELVKILMSHEAAQGIRLLEELGLLKFILPELLEGAGVAQNKHHIYAVFEHNLRALDYAAKQNYPLEIRMASLLHDVGKPRVKKGEGPDSTFYGHEAVGAKMALRMLTKLKFSRDFIEKVVNLVRFHLFYYNVDEVTAAGVRRFLRRVGPENVDDLIKVREADRIGSGVPKAVPYKLRHLLFMIEKVKHDPISPKMLKVSGTDVMNVLKIPAGPKIGWILAILLDEIIENPEKNDKIMLEARIKELGKMPDKALEEATLTARKRKEEFETGIEEEMKKKYYVK